jgi:sugar O-acyltransferase (sialic acid O-acetyltransferase NeuD family)
MKYIFLIGAGGLFKEQFIYLKDVLKEKKNKNFKVAGVIDDNDDVKLNKFSGLKIYKPSKIKYSDDIYLILSIGDPKIKSLFIERFKKFNFFNLIHPSSVVSSSAKIGKGLVISPLCCVSADAILHDFNTLNAGVIISHDCIIGKNNNLSPDVKLMGHCKVGKNNFFGAGSLMIPKTSLADNNIVGASTTITKNFESNLTLVGTPAVVTKKNS